MKKQHKKVSKKMVKLLISISTIEITMAAFETRNIGEKKRKRKKILDDHFMTCYVKKIVRACFKQQSNRTYFELSFSVSACNHWLAFLERGFL